MITWIKTWAITLIWGICVTIFGAYLLIFIFLPYELSWKHVIILVADILILLLIELSNFRKLEKYLDVEEEMEKD